MTEERLKELEDLVDDALANESKESLNEWMYQNQKKELETYRAFVEGRRILPEHSDEYILQKYVSTAGRDSQLNQAESNKSTIKQGWSYWDVTITYEFKTHTSNHPSMGEWTFTSNETGSGILTILDLALSEFDVYRYTWLRVGYELRFINLNIKLIEK